MSEEVFFSLLALAVVGHILITPIVLIVMVRRLKRRVDELEAGHARAQPVPKVVAQREPTPQSEPTPVAVRASVPASAPSEQSRFTGSPVPIVEPTPEREPLIRRLGPVLRRMGILPPEDSKGAGEAVLMQWWLPRMGGLLALLSALFFGVYINQDTAPWFKCLELFSASLAVAVGGRFLERRYAGFGGVLVVTGLIMLYLTSVAAYLLPATRVIEHPLPGALVQAAVLAVICSVGLLRRSRVIILLAFYFSIFMGLFMVWEGLREGALIAAALLLMAGLVIARMADLSRLHWVLIPGTWIVGLAFAGFLLVRGIDQPRALSMQIFNGFATAILLGSWLAGWLGEDRAARLRLALVTTLAVALAGIYFRIAYPLELEWSMLSLGLILLAAGSLAWFLRGCGFAAQLLLVKASFLIGVFFVLHHAGDLRWMVLALGTLFLALTAGRAWRASLEVAVWVVAVVSFHYYLEAFSNLPAAHSFNWWMAAIYPAALVASFSLLLPAFDSPGFSIREASRKWLYWLPPVVAMVMWGRLFDQTPDMVVISPMAWLVVTYLFGLLALLPLLSRWVCLLMAVLAFITANTEFWRQPFDAIVIALILGASLAAMWSLKGKEHRSARLAANGVHILSVVSLSLFVLQVLADNPTQAALMVVLGYLLLTIGRFSMFHSLGSYALLPLLVLVVSEGQWHVGAGFQAFSLAAGMALVLLPRMRPGFDQSLGWSALRVWSLSGPAILWLFAVSCMDPQARWLSIQAIFLFPGAFLLMAAWRLTDSGYFIGALLFAGSTAIRHAVGLHGGALMEPPWLTDALASGGMLYAFALLWYELRPNPFQIRETATYRRLDNLLLLTCGGLFFQTTVVTFYYEPLGMRAWYTPFLALSAFIMIFAGLVRQDSVIRRLGLILLLIPLVRLFVVDVKDVLHRILAFAAAAALLTLLGYFYNRLSERLRNESEDNAPEEGDT